MFEHIQQQTQSIYGHKNHAAIISFYYGFFYCYKIQSVPMFVIYKYNIYYIYKLGI